MQYRKFLQLMKIRNFCHRRNICEKLFSSVQVTDFGVRIASVLEMTWNPEKLAAWNSIKESLAAKARFERGEIFSPI